MPDLARLNNSTPAQVLPPPPPPLPPSRAISNRPGVLQRLVAPLGLGLSQRVPIGQGQLSGARTQDERTRLHSHTPLPVQTVTHKTGIPIVAVDISPDKTHAILAGKEILKTVRVANGKITEDLNLRSAVISYASAHGSHSGTAIASQRRDFLSATNVKWSHAKYDSIIATAANNGRLSVYDVKRPEVELLWLHEHTRQIHTLGFNPFQGALLLSGSHDGTVKYWDLRMSTREKSCNTLKSTKQFSGRAEAVRHLRWSPTDGVEFITCTDGGTIFKWDSRKMDRPELRINGHEKACYSIDWHPDGRHVVSGSADKNVKVWDFKNPDRRQKPCFQFRAPQAVMNIRWRPASRSSALHSQGDFQSTQLAVGYNADDPRVHIWDLRRPLIPFRELDRYKSPTTCLLWCTKDLLWTVGNEGMFTQTDVRYSPQPPEQISPCTVNWLPTGEYAVFTENQGRRRSIESDEPSVSFREAGRGDLSSGERVTTSRSMTDEEGIHEAFLEPVCKRTQAHGGSVQAVRSLGNTPPSRDDQNAILPLDKTIFDKNNMIHNRQIGVVGKTIGAAVDLSTFQYLAENYARPAMEAERKQNPAEILKRLEEAFKTNGNVCDQVSMHRLAQTWRILGAVIVPELQAWADQNRCERLSQSLKSSTRGGKTNGIIPGIQLPHGEENRDQEFKGLLGSTQAVKRDLFKDIVRNERERLSHEAESTSNMTTPLARPMPDSILLAPSKSPRAFLSLNDQSDVIPHLPLSVMAAHSAAAAASRVLRSDVDKSLGTVTTNDAINPDPPDDTAEAATRLAGGHISKQGTGPQAIKRSKSDWISAGEFRSGDRHRREQSKRAALLEYKAQPKTILHFDTSLEETAQTGLPITVTRHDSTESLEMFSQSTSSSHKAKSTVSSESAGASYGNKASIASEDWAYHHQEGFEPYSSPEDAQRLNPRTKEPTEQKRSSSRNSNRSTSSFPDAPFDFEQHPTKHQVHSWTRSVSRPPQPLARQRSTNRQTSPSPTTDELQSPHYIYTDFRPTDLEYYYTTGQAKPWSALPLISQTIASDLDLGENHAQFSAHLLMHIHPFFFHHKYRKKQPPSVLTLPQTVADRLLHPHVSHRIIESIFQQHHTFLKSLSVHILAAELRNLCVEFGIPSVYRRRVTPDEDSGSSLNDGYSLQTTCTNPACSAPLNFNPPSPDMEPISCARCNTPRPPCPVCLSLQHPTQEQETRTSTAHPETAGTDRAAPAHLWSFCQSCGHSAHMSCMQTWLRRPTSQGECPSAGCGHDCAPGEVRSRRIARLAAAAAAAAAASVVVVHGEKQTAGRNGGGEKRNVASSMKDSWKAPQSAAVERTRGLLRSSVGSAATGTGSESEREGARVAAAATAASGSAGVVVVGGGGASSSSSSAGRKVVRLMTPGEELSRASDWSALS